MTIPCRLSSTCFRKHTARLAGIVVKLWVIWLVWIKYPVSKMIPRRQSDVHFYPESVSFGFHTAEDIRKISVVQITTPESYNALGHPTENGLYDKRMGPAGEKDGHCATCHLQMAHCPGHYGHFELALPCFHPLFLRNVANILKLTCPVCKCFFATGELRSKCLTVQV